MTVSQYLDRWLAHMKGRVRVRVHQGYECLVKLHAIPQLGELRLRDVRPLHLQGLYSELLTDSDHPLSSGTVLNLHLVLTQAFGQAVRWELLPSNPSAGAQPPRPRRRELEVVGPELAERILLAVAGTPLEAPAAIAIATGMRRGEILALRWVDLDAELVTAHVGRTLQQTAAGLMFEQPKTRRSRRSVALPDFLRPYLVRQRATQEERRIRLGTAWHETGLVIDSGDGSPTSEGELRQPHPTPVFQTLTCLFASTSPQRWSSGSASPSPSSRSDR